MIEQFSAGIVVYRRTDRTIEYLLLHYASGHWDFAKGKLEKGETNMQAAIRELKEETGIDDIMVHDGFAMSLDYFFHEQGGQKVHKEVTFFVGRTTQHKVTISYEHQGYTWLPFEQALATLTYTNAKEVLTAAHVFVLEKEDL